MEKEHLSWHNQGCLFSFSFFFLTRAHGISLYMIFPSYEIWFLGSLAVLRIDLCLDPGKFHGCSSALLFLLLKRNLQLQYFDYSE